MPIFESYTVRSKTGNILNRCTSCTQEADKKQHHPTLFREHEAILQKLPSLCPGAKWKRGYGPVLQTWSCMEDT